MNLNITVEDLQLGRYEAQKNVLLHRYVEKRAILNRLGQEGHPPTYLESELLHLMLQAHSETGVVVVCADRGLGKTTSAKFILKNSAGGIMFCNCEDECTGVYWKGVARAVGVPKHVYESDSAWKILLAKAVSAAEKRNSVQKQSTWTDRLLKKMTSACGAESSLDSDWDAPTAQGVVLPNRLKQRGILVFDDFNDVHDQDIQFMKSFFPILDELGVLAFVLVRDKVTADRLISLNGWGRISPLEGICSDSSGASNKRIPLWRQPTWTRAQLLALVKSRSPRVDVEALHIRDGENPFDVLKRARKME